MIQTETLSSSPIAPVMPRANGREKHIKRLQIVAAVILLSLPFMQLFTIDLGFPLKVYEVAIILWAGYSFGTMQITLFDRGIFVKGVLLFAYAFCGLFIILYVFENMGPHTDLARMTPFLDGALKSFYILLCIFGFDIVASFVARDPERAVRLWMYSATASALIQLVLFMITASGHSLPELPGMIPTPRDQQFMIFHGMTFFRAGTFTEGNYAGPFFVLSTLIALSYRRYAYAILFIVTTLSTFSTTAVVGFIVAFAYIVWSDRKNIVIYALIGGIMLMILISTSAFSGILIEKLTDNGEHSSLTVRQKTFLNALEMFEENPFWGVGLEQYGFHKNGNLQWGRQNGASVQLGVMKGIPNNVYMELASELGLIGIMFFLVFLIPILRLAARCPYAPIRAGSFVIIVTWLASPTFSLMYYWVFWAMACGIARHKEIAMPIPAQGKIINA